MAFDPRNFLKIAEFLRSEVCNSLDREACLRSLVGRAYYAALIYARNCAEDSSKYFHADEESFHPDVRTWYKTIGRIDVSETLNILRQYRNRCDYGRPTPANLEKIASTAISEANRIIASVK